MQRNNIFRRTGRRIVAVLAALLLTAGAFQCVLDGESDNEGALLLLWTVVAGQQSSDSGNFVSIPDGFAN